MVRHADIEMFTKEEVYTHRSLKMGGIVFQARPPVEAVG